MANKKDIKIGIIEECLPNLQNRVRMPDGKLLLCYQAGKLKLGRIKILVGDMVEVVHTKEMGDIGRIIWRR